MGEDNLQQIELIPIVPDYLTESDNSNEVSTNEDYTLYLDDIIANQENILLNQQSIIINQETLISHTENLNNHANFIVNALALALIVVSAFWIGKNVFIALLKY